MRDWFERVPKVELHLHLQGAVPHVGFFELVRKYGGDPALPDAAALVRRFAYRDFPHFIETWVRMLDWIREYDDLAFMAEAVARELAAQNVRYAEAFVSSTDHARHGLATGRIFEAVRRGLDRVPEVRVALVADLVRDHGPLRAERTLAEQRVPLELCPTSNVRTRVVDSLAAHPVRRYFDLGLPVSINTDDPAMFGCSLAGEYRALAETHGFRPDDIRSLILAAAEASWLDAPGRAALASSLRADPGWGDPR